MLHDWKAKLTQFLLEANKNYWLLALSAPVMVAQHSKGKEQVLTFERTQTDWQLGQGGVPLFTPMTQALYEILLSQHSWAPERLIRVLFSAYFAGKSFFFYFYSPSSTNALTDEAFKVNKIYRNINAWSQILWA